MLTSVMPEYLLGFVITLLCSTTYFFLLSRKQKSNKRDKKRLKQDYLNSLIYYSKNPYDLQARDRCYKLGTLHYRYFKLKDYENYSKSTYGRFAYEVDNSRVRTFLVNQDIQQLFSDNSTIHDVKSA
ncbi:MAG: hypothetical protein ISR65_13755 [Bacteriovoracaceae bacterium]|nr:hypothetical protein [Bacteriovoracaceae bacterium]